MEKPRPDRNRGWTLATAGGELVLMVCAGALIGHWLDHLLGTTPGLMAGGVLVGFTLGMWVLYRAATRE